VLSKTTPHETEYEEITQYRPNTAKERKLECRNDMRAFRDRDDRWHCRHHRRKEESLHECRNDVTHFTQMAQEGDEHIALDKVVTEGKCEHYEEDLRDLRYQYPVTRIITMMSHYL